jgi:Tol biopolymer transport system component
MRGGVLRKDEQHHLAIMSADGTDSRTLAESIATQESADWSPDGKWIVAGGSDAQGPALFKIPMDGGAPVRLVGGQAVSPVWSRDGKLIVYAGPLEAGEVPLLGVRPDGAPVELPPVKARPGGYRFLPNGTGLVYLIGSDQLLNFWLLDLATKTTRQLTRFNNQGDLRAFDITPDGKHIVFDRSRENSDIVLIDLPKCPTTSGLRVFTVLVSFRCWRAHGERPDNRFDLRPSR